LEDKIDHRANTFTALRLTLAGQSQRRVVRRRNTVQFDPAGPNHTGGRLITDCRQGHAGREIHPDAIDGVDQTGEGESIQCERCIHPQSQC